MKKITESMNDLMTYRADEIRETLKPIIPSKFLERQLIYIDVLYQYGKTIFSVASQGKQPENYEDRKFSVIGERFTATYYEVWCPATTQTLYLDRAYFHLYKLEEVLDDIEENDFVYLHCDPNELDKTHWPYKLTPHMHILQHDSSLTHAHLTLHLYKQEELLDNRGAMTDAISSALKMLSTQLLM